MSELVGPVQHVELASWLWLVPAAPLVGAVTNALFGRKLQRSSAGHHLAHGFHVGSLGVTLVALGAMLTSFVVALAHVVRLVGLEPERRYLLDHLWQMVRIGSIDFSFDLALDPLSSVMILVITGVGSLIHLYAAAYMAEDEGYWKFFSYLNLFVFSMLLLVLGDGFMTMFFGWEGVGLCSYLLIGFWHHDYAKASAGMKAFVVNRIGDWGFVSGVLLLAWGLGGAWPGGQWQSDDRAPLAAIARGEAGHHGEAEHAKAEHGPAAKSGEGGASRLTMTALPGARVYLDGALFDARTAPYADDEAIRAMPAHERPTGTSPFVDVPVRAGMHTLRVERGLGAPDYVVENFEAGAGREVVITPVGTTLTFRQIHDQLVASDGHGDAPFRSSLQGKQVFGGMSLITLACLLLFVGATGKSAQLPLYVWLPDAMAGPTPVSALIHAATMVTAGVYMIARLGFLFALSPGASAVIATVGAATALFAASIGFFQHDIKKVLAYSTVSQLGFMFLGVGVGAYWAGVFHLVTHAFFKACLFLASGSVIHGMHHVVHDEAGAQDLRNMGGLRGPMPKTARAYFVACLAISAAPVPFLAGFWSKDEILWKTLTTGHVTLVPPIVLYLMGLAAAACTSFYMWRSYYLAFEGKPAKASIPEKVHESPGAMTSVLSILAVASAFAGIVLGASTHLVGGHGHPLLEAWLEPVLEAAEVPFHEAGLASEYLAMAVSVGIAVLTWSRAKKRYGAGRSERWAEEERSLPFYGPISRAWGVDEFYRDTIVAAVLRLRVRLANLDRYTVDGIVNLFAIVGRGCAWIGGAIDSTFVDGAVNAVANGTLALGERARRVQTGRIQTYVYGMLGGVAGLALLLWLFSP